MKNWILFIFLLFGFTASAQSPAWAPTIKTPFRYNRIWVDELYVGHQLPSLNVADSNRIAIVGGVLYNSFYNSDCSCSQWKVAGGISSITSSFGLNGTGSSIDPLEIDSLLISTKGRLYKVVDSLFGSLQTKGQIVFAGTNGKILGDNNFTRDSASGFLSVKVSSADGIGIYGSATPSAGNQTGNILFGANLSGGYNDFAEIRPIYEGDGTTRSGRLVIATRGPDAAAAFGAQFYGNRVILGANQVTTPFGSSLVTVRSNGVSNSPGSQSPFSISNLDSTVYWQRSHISGRTSFGKSTDNGIGKVQVGGKLTIDTVSTGSNTDSVLTILNNEVRKVAASEFGGGGGGSVDTAIIATRLRLQKVADSLGALIGGSSLASESSTSLKIGTGSLFHSTPTGGTATGINTGLFGINSNVFGYNSRVGQSGISIGANIYNGATPPNLNIILSKDITTTKVGQQYEIVIGQTVTLANGYGNIHIGDAHNVTSSNPSNTSLNKGIHIGNSITRASGSYTGGIIAGNNINTYNANDPIVLAVRPTLSSNMQNSIIIGLAPELLDGQQNSVGIGDSVKIYVDPTYGTSGGEQTALGPFAQTGAWRAFAGGGRARALAVSSFALGYGSYSNAPHGGSLGRGAYNDNDNSILLYGGGSATTDYHFGGVAAKWLNPAMPSGGEAVDFSSDLNSGLKIARLMGVSGRDATASPTLTNTRGGHIRIMGGPGTGTAAGGDIQFAVTLPGGSSNNTENQDSVLARFSALTGNFEIGNLTGKTVGKAKIAIRANSVSDTGAVFKLFTTAYDSAGFSIRDNMDLWSNGGASFNRGTSSRINIGTGGELQFVGASNTIRSANIDAATLNFRYSPARWGALANLSSTSLSGQRLSYGFSDAANSGTVNILLFDGTYNQTGTSTMNINAINYNPTITSLLGTHNFITASTGNVLFATTSGNLGVGVSSTTSKVDVSATNGYSQLRLRTTYTPASTADSNGNTGDTAWDDNYFYIKTSAGWKRSALSTF